MQLEQKKKDHMTLTGVKSILTTSTSPSQDAVAMHIMNDSCTDNLVKVIYNSVKGMSTWLRLTGVKSILTTSTSPSRDAVAMHIMNDLPTDNLVKVIYNSVKVMSTWLR